MTGGAVPPVAEFGAEAGSEAAMGQLFADAFRAAESPRLGAAFVALPANRMEGAAPDVVSPQSPRFGSGPGRARPSLRRRDGK